MLFLRRFIHDILPAILIALGILVFSAFSFGGTSSRLTQYRALLSSGYQEMCYSGLPYADPETGTRENSFADFNGVRILKSGKMSLSSDIYMVLPEYSYTDILPFFDIAMTQVKQGEALVSANVMDLRRLHIGDQLVTNDRDDGEFTIVGTLPSIKGFESAHHGIVVLGYDPQLEAQLIAVKPHYVNFSVRFGSFGFIPIEGNIILKADELSRMKGEILPPLILGGIVGVMAPLLVGLLYTRDYQRKNRLLVESGARTNTIFLHHYGYALLLGLPAAFVALIFALMHLEFVPGTWMVFALLAGALFLSSTLTALVFSWRSAK